MSGQVRVTSLRVNARGAGEEHAIVNDVSFSIPKGEVLALIGESGSGKTTVALALMGYARSGCRIAAGAVRIGATEVLSLTPRQRLKLRGRSISYIAQSAAAAFNPSLTVMEQVIEPALIHGLLGRADAEAKAVALFRALALPSPDDIGHRYPHQVSGGQLQRLMAAMALITDPALVIFDEPTTALDVTTQVEVLRAFKKIVRACGTTAVYVSHDLAVVAQMADQIVVLNHGVICEQGRVDQVLNEPADGYTRALLAAARPISRGATGAAAQPAPAALISIQGLSAGYGPRDAQGLPRNLVLHDVDLTIQRGKTLGVIGESGSGKSTLARVIAGLIAPAHGCIHFDGAPLPASLTERTRDQFRRIQIVFQNADTALNPAHTVAQILGRPLAFYHGMRGAERQQRIAELLDLVKLPVSVARRQSSELSGGQKQRVNLARALAAEPDLILCDEVTSALDTVVGAAILDLMAELRSTLNLSYMFISHDISTVRTLCDDIMVLYSGRKVEAGTRKTLLAPPLHPYTALLVSSVPELRRGWLEQVGAPRALPTIGPIAVASREPVALCSFLDRCPVRIDGVCNVRAPVSGEGRDGKEILCHHSDAELLVNALR